MRQFLLFEILREDPKDLLLSNDSKQRMIPHNLSILYVKRRKVAPYSLTIEPGH